MSQQDVQMQIHFFFKAVAKLRGDKEKSTHVAEQSLSESDGFVSLSYTTCCTAPPLILT